MGQSSVYQRALLKAHAVLGGTLPLCRHLHVSPTLLSDWLSGLEEVPDAIFLQVVDLVLKDLERDEERDVLLLLEEIQAKEEKQQRN